METSSTGNRKVPGSAVAAAAVGCALAPDPRRACVPLAIEESAACGRYFFRISPRGRVLVRPGLME
jgi:hypothetical protein